MTATPNQKMEAASSVQQKDKMAGGTPRKLCMSHSVGNGTRGELLPYMGYIGMYHCEEYGF